MNYNKVFIAGNMTRDVSLKYLPNQTAVAEFGVAVKRKYKSNGEAREDTCFVDCTAFGKTAETINTYFQKGKPIFVEGRLKYDTWEAKDGGGKRSKLSVVVDQFQFVGGPPRESGDDGDQQYPRSAESIRREKPALDDRVFDKAGPAMDDVPF